MGTTGQALAVVNEVNDPNFGINIDIGHSLIARENVEDQISLVLRHKKLFHTHFDDNDQQADADIPPGTANFIRLVSIIYVLDQMKYEDWFGLDLFPYRDDSVDFMKLAVENLRFAQSVVDLMNKKGARELRAKGTDGPAMARLIRDCIREAK
jgi:xylose isomerase